MAAAPYIDPDEATQPPPFGAPPPAPPVYEGPQLPDFIDRTIAQPLPPGASNGTMPEDQWPPPVPPEAPGMVPPPGAPPAPASAPAPPGAAPGPPLPPGMASTPLGSAVTDAAGAAKDASAARAASDKAQLDAAEAGRVLAADNARIAAEKVRRDQELDRRREQVQQRYDAADQIANHQIEQTQQAIKNFKFRDYWADKSSAQRVGSALAVALGAFGSGLTKTPNYALQVLEKEMDRDHQQQVDEFNKLKDEEVMARTGLTDSQQARTRAMADITQLDAAKDKLIADQLDEAAARNKNDSFGQSLAAFAAKLREESAQKDAQAKQMLVGDLLKLQDEGRKATLDQASIAEKNSLAHLHDVQAAAGGFARVARGHGGAGGGGAGLGAAAEELARRIEEGKDGRPLSEAEMIHAANELHVPLEAKAGGVSLKSIAGSVAFRRKEVGAGAKAAGADIGAIDKRAQGIRDKELVGTQKSAGPLQLLDRMESMSHALGHAIQAGDKTAALLALDEGSRMISGSAPTKTSTHLLQELKSAQDELNERWGRISGDPGATKAFTGRLQQLINLAAEEKRQQIDQVRARYLEQELGPHGFSGANPVAKERVLGQAAALFGNVRNADGSKRYAEGGGGGGGQQPQAAGKRIRLKNGQTGTLMPDGTFHQD